MATQLQALKSIITAPDVQESFSKRLVDKTMNFDREASFALQSLAANDYTAKIAMQNKQSLLSAVSNIAAIGISLNPAKKQAYLVPRKGAICLDISYIGLLELAMASGSIRWGQARTVHENDMFQLNGLDKQPTHQYQPFGKDRGEIVGVYVTVKTNDGDYLTDTMTVEEVNGIRDRSESFKKGKSSPWTTDYAEMAKKTVVKRAYKYWPKTDRLEEAIHYLNTEGDEGIGEDFSPNELLKRWVDDANACQTQEELKALWPKGLRELKKTGSAITLESFREAVKQRGEQLKTEESSNTYEGEYHAVG